MNSLPEVISVLLDPRHYPDENPTRVELLQTQMSFVLLTDNYAYKIRKPVDLGYVDYSTLEKRKYFSEQELVLNRRLCPDTYIGIVPIVKKNGTVSIGGDGEIIEYAVKMIRLPAAGMMDRLLESETITDAMIAAVAGKLAEFHAKAESNPDISRFGSLETITGNVNENFDQSRPFIDRVLSRNQFNSLEKYFDNFLKDHQAAFNRRAEAGYIRDCHGDLHSAHINIRGEKICIYDCIEFNERFRYGDTASEVAFLAMDLDHYGRADLRRAFIFEYINKSGDRGICELVRFYQAYRAHIRAKVACFKLDDPFVPDAEKTLETARAKAYFDLALSYTVKRPQLYITVGFTGCGKSTLAAELTRHLGLHHFSSDRVRKRLADIPAHSRSNNRFEAGIYSKEMTEKTYSTLLEAADQTLAFWDSVIIDATFLRSIDRERAAKLAQKHNAEFTILDCRLTEESIKSRLLKRQAENTLSDGTWEIFLRQKQIFEPVAGIPSASNHVIIDTLKPVAENVREIVELLT